MSIHEGISEDPPVRFVFKLPPIIARKLERIQRIRGDETIEKTFQAALEDLLTKHGEFVRFQIMPG